MFSAAAKEKDSDGEEEKEKKKKEEKGVKDAKVPKKEDKKSTGELQCSDLPQRDVCNTKHKQTYKIHVPWTGHQSQCSVLHYMIISLTLSLQPFDFLFHV